MSTTPISIRVDTRVLDWFKDNHPKYQSVMKQVLREYMEKHMTCMDMAYQRPRYHVRVVAKCNPGMSVVREICSNEGEARGYAIELENAGESVIVVNSDTGTEVYKSIDIR